MPFSSPVFDDELVLYFQGMPHDVIVDIGPGEGKYGKLIRQHQPRARLIGVEIDPDYVERFQLRDVYDEIRIQDAAELMNDPAQAFSAVVIGDCIEHLKKSTGVDLINFLVYRAQILIVKFPVGIVQDVWEGHTSEAHVSVWSEYDFRGFDYLFVAREAMRICFVRGYRSRVAAWLPPQLLEHLGYGRLELFGGDEDHVVTSTFTNPVTHERTDCHWSMSDLEARRLNLIAWELHRLMPTEATCVFVDNDRWPDVDLGRPRLPFLEREGRYWGPPADSATAIVELERMRSQGAGFLAFTWSAFWWLDHYRDFHAHLCAHYRPVGQCSWATIFDLREKDATAGSGAAPAAVRRRR